MMQLTASFSSYGKLCPADQRLQRQRLTTTAAGDRNRGRIGLSTTTCLISSSIRSCLQTMVLMTVILAALERLLVRARTPPTSPLARPSTCQFLVAT